MSTCNRVYTRNAENANLPEPDLSVCAFTSATALILDTDEIRTHSPNREPALSAFLWYLAFACRIQVALLSLRQPRLPYPYYVFVNP